MNEMEKEGVSGPPDYEIRAALTVEEDSLSLWTEGMKKVLPEQVDPAWWEDLKTSEFTWEISADAEYYIQPGSQTYVVACPDIHLILKMVSTSTRPLPLEELTISEELSGYDQSKTLVADELGYDHSTVPYIKTMLAEQTYTSDGTALSLICYQALFCNSTIHGIPVLAIDGGGSPSCTVLCDRSYNDNWYLADIDGDGFEELLMQHLIGITGGAGTYETDVYRLSDHGITKIFGSPDSEDGSYFNTQFTLRLSEGYTHTVQNDSVGFEVSFIRETPEDSPYFDVEGSLTDDAREINEANWMSADPYFFLFKPVDADGDGVYEIMTAQYTYLYGHSDGLGAAYTILKWSSSEYLYVEKAGFWPYEDYEGHEEGYEDYGKRWEEYENSWYLE